MYVVSGNPGSITHFRRDTTTGSLTYAGCIGTADGCRQTGPAGAFTDVTASTDGTSVYAGIQGPSWSWERWSTSDRRATGT